MRRLGVCLLALVVGFLVPLGQVSPTLAAPKSPAQTAKADVFAATVARQGTQSSNPGAPPQTAKSREVAAMRGRNERTFATDAGYVTELYASSINYLDAKGKWQAIDDTLIPANAPGFSLKNKANGYTAFLPTSLASPIRIALTSGSIDLQLAGADGAIASQGSTATYAGALNGVTLSYDARPDSLKETITLASAQAPSTFKYNLTLPAGWSAQTVTGGGIRILDAKGTNHAVLLAPFMVDALHQAAPSDALSMTLSGSSPHFAVTVAADKNWIAASSRAFPVVIDPTIWTNVNYYGGQDCFLENTSPSTSFCSSNGYTGTTDLVGYNGTKIDRAIYLFPFQTGYTHIAPNANILDAELDLTLAASTSGSAVATTVYPITQSWSDSGASWNNASTGVAWTAPGGTVGSALSTINVGPAAGAVAWYGLTQEIQNEVKGSAAIDGFLIRTANEGANAQLQFDNYNIAPGTDTRRPHLRIQWNAWGGLQPFFKFDGVKQLDDRMSIAVNVANGQLVVHNQDLAVRGVGLNLTVDRFYNSLSDLSWHLGNGWNLSAGCDVRVDIDDHDGVSLWTPDGYEVLYRNNGSGGYITPPGINADLVKNWDSTFTLTFHGSNTKYNFQTGGCLQNEKDRNGNTISMSYNGSLATITDTENRATTLTYASPIDSDFISQITDSASRTYKYTYDSNRNLISYVDANSNTTSYQYNANNQMSQIQDPRGNLVNFTYSSTYPQPLTQISYVNTACPGGTCNTNFAYNSGAGPCTTSGIWHNTVVTDANGHTTTYCYENRGHVLEVRDANNNQRSTSYNSNSNVTSLTDAVSSITQLTYDTNNNLTQMQSPPTASGQSPAVTSFGYQAPGQTFLPSSRTDSQGNCRAFTYDSVGNLINSYDGQTSPCDGATGGVNSCNAYQGDPSGTCGATSTVTCTNAVAGELCWTKDGNGNKATYAYDSNHNLSTITPPSPLGTTAIVADSLSRVSSMTDGKGQKMTYSYDALDRITQILFGGATSCTLHSNTCSQFFYDNDGNLIKRTDATGDTLFSYDSMNRLTLKSLPSRSWDCAGQGGMSFSYDPVGNLTVYCDVGGTVTYTYDSANRVQNLAEPTGTCSGTPSLCSTYVYDNDNRLTTLTFPGGATQNLTYDGAGNEKAVIGKDSAGNVLTSFSYTYAAGTQDKGVRLSATEADPLANLTTSYSYDAFGRLITASNAQTTLRYAYDAAGNRCSTGTSCDGTWTYNAANELTGSPGVSAYSYDADGNLTGSSTGGSFTYNSQSQTTAATWNNQTLPGMTYADVGQSERTAASTMTYASSPLGLQILTTGGSNTYFLHDGKGNLIGQILPGNPPTHWYYLKDGLGSVVAVINGTGSSVANSYVYDPYGKVTASMGTQSNPWGYASGLLDTTGLVKFGARYYDPNLGRWTQRDAASMNHTYLYARDNPTNRRDPNGHCAVSDFWFASNYFLNAVFNQWGAWLAPNIPDIAGGVLGIESDPETGPIGPDPFAWLSDYYASVAQYDKGQAIEYWNQMQSDPFSC